ncbi:LysR substrate-binding domain-containing protein [Lichenicola cladoniae]|uniref:LysR substrate-binding domain-containing protein n=1 Tax=Lichenicola cladoniae TaxID=1484109 RepID=UPI001EF5BF09|nr:LysR substrate-binding domain-containing protein [Lichenicola cladoniae]
MIYVRALESLTEDLKKQLESHDNIEELTIGMAEDFCRTALATILWLFVAEHPNIRVRIISGTYSALTEGIEKKTIDFAIMRRFGEYADSRLLWRDNLAWIGRKNMRLSREEPVPLVLPLPPNPGRDMPIAMLRASGRSCFIRFESVGLAGIEAAVQAGLGICAGPRSMWLAGAAPLVEGHGLPDLPDVEFDLVTVKPPKKDFSKAFLQILTAASKSGFIPQRDPALPAAVVS